MNELNANPQTLQEAMKYFADPDRAQSLIAAARWPDGVVCPHCGTVDDNTYMEKYSRWQCRSCREQFTVRTRTIFEDSPLALEKWLAAIWLVTNAKNGISSYEIHRAIAVTQKTAWFLLHRIRAAMQAGSFDKMVGPVEVDETFIGGLEKNKHKYLKLNKGRGAVGKEIVMGILERGGKIRVKHIPDTEKDTLQDEIKANVEEGASVFTDAAKSYRVSVT